MNRAWPLFLVTAFLCIVTMASPVHAQLQERDGLWYGGGLAAGFSDIDCAECGRLYDNDPWEGGLGFAGAFAIGRALTSQVLAGAELNFWGRRSGELSRDATLLMIGVGGRIYPVETGRLHATVFLGLGHSILAGNGLIESPGFAAGIGAGYDVPLGGRVALSPFVKFFQIVGEGGEGRNRGAAAEGPDNPRAVTVGLSLMRF